MSHNHAFNYYQSEFDNIDLALHTFIYDYDVLSIAAGTNYCFMGTCPRTGSAILMATAHITTQKGELFVDMPLETLNFALER